MLKPSPRLWSRSNHSEWQLPLPSHLQCVQGSARSGQWLNPRPPPYACRVCTEAVLIPGEKVPAMILGPQLNLTVSLGSCNITEGWHNKTLNCVHPSVSYVKVRPPTAVSFALN